MITGDGNISPDNNDIVKVITNINNKEGHQIKVLLISKAGSEGIDLKYIRQIHVMEPWYNMNRIEQIIGRAVRNFSHKDLPFEKRNVQIFLYGTILKNALEEAADLYVYRISEIKAVKIGKVTRLLKETAVDCIINHGQTEFTPENFIKDIPENRNISQIMSTGNEIEDFEIGDKPNSANCDYMDTCEFKCLIDQKKNLYFDDEIDEDMLNKDTYNEAYMLVNSDKIIQKVKALMKES
jgi:superfamily II DNA or RNA helicase